MGNMHRRASEDKRIATTDLAHDLTLVTRDAKLENQGVRRLIPILCVSGGVNDLLDEMKQCKSVRACIELALTDAYGDYEQACAWLRRAHIDHRWTFRIHSCRSAGGLSVELSSF
jgi:hypothetical protein